MNQSKLSAGDSYGLGLIENPIKTKLLLLPALLAASPLIAETFSVSGDPKNPTVISLDGPDTAFTFKRREPVPAPRPGEPAPALQPTALDYLEAAFYGGTISPAVAAQRVSHIPEAGGFAWIAQNGYDPTQLDAGRFRTALAPQIKAVEFDRRLHGLIDAINAAIKEQNATNKTAGPAPVAAQAPAEQAFQARVEASKQKANALYPSFKDADSPISQKWTEVYERLRANNDPLVTQPNPDLPLIVAQMAAAELRIASAGNAVSPAPVTSTNDTAQAQREAMRLYPELAESGSALNRQFLAAVEQARKSEPALFQRSDWPLVIAKQTAKQALEAGIKESKERARTLYPAVNDPTAPLFKKWTEVFERLQANNDPLVTQSNPNTPLIITQMAAAELGIAPASGTTTKP